MKSDEWKVIEWDEFIARAREVNETDRNIALQLRQLYVDRGTLQQTVATLLTGRDAMLEALSRTQMVTEEAIRQAIGIQGQIAGIDACLGTILDLMNVNPKDQDDGRNAEA